MMLPNFVGASYQAQSTFVDAEECINLFVEAEQVTGQQQPRLALYRDPGLRVFTTAGNGPIRQLWSQDGRHFAVSGTGFYEIFNTGTVTLRGTVASDRHPASICSNGTGGNQLLVISGGKGYVYSLTANTLTLIADADFPANVSMGGFVDGYGLVHVTDTATFYISALEDFTSWDPTDVFQKSHTADSVRAMVVDHGLAWLFGSRTIEPWYDSGDATTPFQPVPDVMIMQGILSVDAWDLIDNTMFWAGETEAGGRVAYKASGFSPQRISTHAVEAAWRAYGDVTDVTVWNYTHQGHPCVQFDFPSQGISWVFDTHTNLWHKRGYWNQGSGSFEAHLGRCHVYAFDTHLVGSRVDGTIYEQRADVYADGSSPHRWLRRAPALKQELRNVVHGRFWLDMEVGSTPLSTGQGSDPRVMMRFSDSSARRWSNEYWKSTGKMGEDTTRVIWDRVGLAKGPQGRVYEVSGTDPVPIALRGAGVDLGA